MTDKVEDSQEIECYQNGQNAAGAYNGSNNTGRQQDVSADQNRPTASEANNSRRTDLDFPHYCVVPCEVTEGQESSELEALLNTDIKKGLTTEEHLVRLTKFGKNELLEAKPNRLLKFLGYFTDPIAILIIIAMILTAIVEDFVDFAIISVLLLVNAVIGFFMESHAESALDALKSNLAIKTRCWRDGKLLEIDSSYLVPGDIIVLRLGDIVPADSRLLGVSVTGEPTDDGLHIDESALTGESLPAIKNKMQVVYSSSIIKQGQMMAVVIKTGGDTFIGRAANLISITNEKGHFQKVVGQIGNFLVIVTITMVLILLFYLLIKHNWRNPMQHIKSIVVLTVAAVPVGLPTVLSVTMAMGAKQLAQKRVIVKRLTAVEEMASVSILCSDKTGTLTLNQLTFDDPWLLEGFTVEDILFYSFMASEPGANDPIEKAVRTAALQQVPCLKNLPEGNVNQIPGFKVIRFVPFNSTSKRTQATVVDLSTNETFSIAKGAPPTIIEMVGEHEEAVCAVNELAAKGLRALGVARTYPGRPEEWHLVGMISLLDPPRPDSAQTISKCHDYGIKVKMITGDQLIIAKEVAHRMGMQRAILNANKLVEKGVDEEIILIRCIRADGFAQVIPEHKYRVVELLQRKGFLVGMTGDGVNDAPALKKANVGIAVHNCTDAARSAADIVLLASGLSTIIDGITTSRAIFQRMRSYSLYRITSTVHVLLFFFMIILIREWHMHPVLLILIAVLNDIATIVIAFDDAQISQRPDKWRIGQLIFLSIILALCLSCLSFAHFYIAQGLGFKSYSFDKFGNMDEKTSELQSVMYLHISSAPHFVIFSTRLSGFFWENLPSWIFFTSIIATQIFATVLVIFGIPGLIAPIGVAAGLTILAISLVFFVILDIIKVCVFRLWSFEFTAMLWPTPKRRRKLLEHKKTMKKHSDLSKKVSKIRKVCVTVEAINRFTQ